MSNENKLPKCAVAKIIFDGEQKGFRGYCKCGWESTLCGKIEYIGAEFDEHFEDSVVR